MDDGPAVLPGRIGLVYIPLAGDFRQASVSPTVALAVFPHQSSGEGSVTDMRTLSTRARQRAVTFAGAVCLAALAAPPAFAAINDPPALPHSVIAFPVRDFVSADNYDPAAG